MFIFLIRKIRKAKNITQEELAQKTGVSRSYIAELESNIRTNPSFEMIYKISQVLEVEITKIFVAVSNIEEARTMLHNSIDEKGINNKEVLQISCIIDKSINKENRKIRKKGFVEK